MRHNLILAGPAFRLRPIGDADAHLHLELRCNPYLNRFLHATSSSVEDQLAWLADYYERPEDYYFVVERLETGAPEGVISVYDIDFEIGSGEWGRWILKPGSLAAVESAWLIYRYSFEQLKLAQVYCRTVADNQPVVSFHDSCGIPQRRLLPGHFDFGGNRVDAVEHLIDHWAWTQISPRLEKLAQLTARRLKRG
jgi:RimJ/RimL family protein N-acetyltransferase